MVRGMELAGRFPAETRHIRGTLAYTQLDYVATLWTRRRFEPNREHVLRSRLSSGVNPVPMD